MTLSTRSPYDERRLAGNEFHIKLSAIVRIIIILAGCFGLGIIVVLTTTYTISF